MNDLFDAIAYAMNFVFSADGAQFFATFGSGGLFVGVILYIIYAPKKKKARHPYLF